MKASEYIIWLQGEVQEHGDFDLPSGRETEMYTLPDLIPTQELLGEEFQAVLTANLWNLYEESNMEEQPYLTITKTTQGYNPNYGAERICKCGHPYYRHFDPYEEDNPPVGCKYCSCFNFEERKE